MMRAIEVGFPIVEINRLAVPERYSFKPVYQMHKWFARRASCVFRAILLGALKPALGPDGKPTDLMEEFYKDHTHDPDTRGKVILDPFMLSLFKNVEFCSTFLQFADKQRILRSFKTGVGVEVVKDPRRPRARSLGVRSESSAGASSGKSI